MKLNVTVDNGTLTATLDGRLDTATAPLLTDLLNETYDSIEALILDCEKLTYISSAGLRVLLTAHKRMNGKMTLTKVGELVMEVFEMTGFADILVIA